MAYTIRFTTPSDSPLEAELFRKVLVNALFDSPFVCEVTQPSSTFRGLPARSPRPRWELYVKKVRLKTKKPYCGQHPGPCVVDGRRKPKASYLEWDDWIEFHGIVNTLLTEAGFAADVWSSPFDVKGLFWIRKDNKPRVKFDWEERTPPGRIHPVRIWNPGTPDQFEAA